MPPKKDPEPELIYVEEYSFDLEDLTYGERREIKRIAKTEIFDEAVDESWTDMNEDDIMPAIITVLMRRHDPKYTLQQALELRPEQITTPPPTNGGSPRSSAAASGSKRSTAPRRASADTGPRS